MSLFYLQMFQTLGGRTATDQFTNDFMIRGDFEIQASELHGLANDLAIIQAGILLPKTRILRVVISKVDPNDALKTFNGEFRTISVNRTGTRTVPEVYTPAAIDICATFGKNAIYGHAGREKVRGVFHHDEIVISDDLTPTTKAGFSFTAFDTYTLALKDVFDERNCVCVLPANGDNKGEDYWREVSSWTFTGVSQHQRRNSRTSIAKAEENVFQRALKALIAAIMNALEQGLAQLATDLFEIFADDVIAFIRKWGIQRILKQVMPTIVRALMTMGAARLAAV